MCRAVSSDSGIILPRNSCRHLSVIRERLNRKLRKVSQNHLGIGNKPLSEQTLWSSSAFINFLRAFVMIPKPKYKVRLIYIFRTKVHIQNQSIYSGPKYIFRTKVHIQNQSTNSKSKYKFKTKINMKTKVLLG